MQQGIHPQYDKIHVTCSCGEAFDTYSTLSGEKKELHLDVCSKCHPFFTGKQKLIDTSGRIDRFRQRYASKAQQMVSAKEEATATTDKTKAKSKAKAKAK